MSTTATHLSHQPGLDESGLPPAHECVREPLPIDVAYAAAEEGLQLAFEGSSRDAIPLLWLAWTLMFNEEDPGLRCADIVLVATYLARALEAHEHLVEADHVLGITELILCETEKEGPASAKVVAAHDEFAEGFHERWWEPVPEREGYLRNTRQFFLRSRKCEYLEGEDKDYFNDCYQEIPQRLAAGNW